MRKPIAVSDLLAEGKAKLERLMSGAEAAGRTLVAVRAVVTPEVAAHVFGASLKGEELTVLVDSGSWATRVRYVIPELAPAVAAGLGVAVTSVRVRVRPPPSR
jgi:predicted nucleic acid-binding Zn ribbon protein